jgi:hypothetical protein
MITLDQYRQIKNSDRIIMSEDEKIIFRDKSNDQRSNIKPSGLWYAAGTEWIDWVRDEMPHWEQPHFFKLEINPSKVLIIDTSKKLQEFENIYKKESEKNPWDTTDTFWESSAMIKWSLVSQEYSGIEIIPYQGSMRNHVWYNGWDVASGCIWKRDGIVSVKRIV